MEENETLTELDTIESLVDDVMEAAAEVRNFIRNRAEEYDKDTEDYIKMVDDKMNYILSELF